MNCSMSFVVVADVTFVKFLDDCCNTVLIVPLDGVKKSVGLRLRWDRMVVGMSYCCCWFLSLSIECDLEVESVVRPGTDV